MGDKKKKGNRQNHVQQSMGQLVSKAALAQLGPHIERYVQAVVQDLGSKLAVQQASTLETIFSRVVVLENIVMEKLNYTKADLATLVAEMEDEKEGYTLVDGTLELGDMVRITVETRAKDQDKYQGDSKLKVYDTGNGRSIGKELELSMVGMKAGEVKEVEFGQDKGMMAKITVNRISRRPKVEQPAAVEAVSENPAQSE